MLAPEAPLGRREAMMRAAAVTCLTGIALVQAVGLAALLAQSRPLGVLSLTAMGLCVALGWTLAAASDRVSRHLWGLVAALTALVLAGWATSRALGLPGLPGQRGSWTAMPGAAAAAFAGTALVLALVAAPPTRASARSLATAAALLAAMGPGAGVLLVATGPGPTGGEATLAAAGHAHGHAAREPEIRFQPGSGRDGGRFVISTTPRPRPATLDVALFAAASLVFLFGAIACLRQRSASWSSGTAPGLL